VAAHNADDLGPPVPSTLGAKREHDENTTRTDACLREQTSTSREPADWAVYQDGREPAPTVEHEPPSTHNPKVAGSNPAPATK
jgi:hypothetical protein